MKHLVMMLAIAAAVSLAGQASATPTAQTACEEAGGTWDAATSTCKNKGY